MKKRDIILDFTSLLDVIMILLFIVMSNMTTASAKLNEETEQAKAELSIANTEISNLEFKLKAKEAIQESYEIYTSEVVIVTILNFERDGSHILTLFEGEDTDDGVTIVMGENSTINTKNRIRKYITDILKETENQPVYIVFRYDKYTIYHSEFETIGEEIKKLSREYKEVFYKEMDISENNIEQGE